MKNLPANLIIEKNKLATRSAWITLLDIALNDAGDTHVRLARNTQAVTFDGNTYQPFNFDVAQKTDDNKGEIPTWTLRVANVTRLLESYLEDTDGLADATVTLIVVNSAHLTEDYTELTKTFDVLDCESDPTWVTLTLGAPNLLRQRFPLRRFMALHCGFHFESAECSYDRHSVAGVTLSGSDPVRLNVDAHSFGDGHSVRLDDINGITPSLAGEWAAGYIDANNFDLVGSDSSSYGGAYTGGGTAGYKDCPRTLAACHQRLNAARFGGAPGLREGGVRVALG